MHVRLHTFGSPLDVPVDHLRPNLATLESLKCGCNSAHAILWHAADLRSRAAVYRLVTAPLVHIGLLHVAFNLLAFVPMGHSIERSLGTLQVSPSHALRPITAPVPTPTPLPFPNQAAPASEALHAGRRDRADSHRKPYEALLSARASGFQVPHLSTAPVVEGSPTPELAVYCVPLSTEQQTASPPAPLCDLPCCLHHARSRAWPLTQRSHIPGISWTQTAAQIRREQLPCCC